MRKAKLTWKSIYSTLVLFQEFLLFGRVRSNPNLLLLWAQCCKTIVCITTVIVGNQQWHNVDISSLIAHIESVPLELTASIVKFGANFVKGQTELVSALKHAPSFCTSLPILQCRFCAKMRFIIFSPVMSMWMLGRLGRGHQVKKHSRIFGRRCFLLKKA